jgi:hypothetical protein
VEPLRESIPGREFIRPLRKNTLRQFGALCQPPFRLSGNAAPIRQPLFESRHRRIRMYVFRRALRWDDAQAVG